VRRVWLLCRASLCLRSQSAEAERLKEERIAEYTARKSKSELGSLVQLQLCACAAVVKGTRTLHICRTCCGGQVQHSPGRKAMG